ncbi:hypothetical protein IQ273_26635 [Nodosilinea sp. LEGE 07298]|uniref:hypothetical protein n=1 Tax=Nodosilinea sp. LEGE 07298 TaxID=2777970 RepID=UPI001880F796|nr:hypothetical protein [Nodosilinea sp. LEGE 07298]MBE9112969.1 hypothetical protein [Nodosilinea sp. LEGE 07298]
MTTTLPTIEQKSEVVSPVEIVEPPTEMALKLPAQGGLVTDTETYSREILGQSQFELYHLKATGMRGQLPPWGPHPEQSKHIIDLDEEMRVGLVIKFDQSPLTRLLLCLGVTIKAYFHFEGLGAASAEKDLEVVANSEEDVFKYWVGTIIKPQDLGLTKGYYLVGATVEVGPLTHRCGQFIFGYGYIGERRVQIADQPFS